MRCDRSEHLDDGSVQDLNQDFVGSNNSCKAPTERCSKNGELEYKSMQHFKIKHHFKSEFNHCRKDSFDSTTMLCPRSDHLDNDSVQN